MIKTNFFRSAAHLGWFSIILFYYLTMNWTFGLLFYFLTWFIRFCSIDKLLKVKFSFQLDEKGIRKLFNSSRDELAK